MPDTRAVVVTSQIREQTSRVDRIRDAVRLEIRACTDRASQVCEQIKHKVENAPAVRLRVVPR